MSPTVENDAPGPTGFAARTPWSPIGAVAAGVLIVLTAVGVAGGMGALYFASLKATGGTAAHSRAISQTNAMLAMLLMQCVIVSLVVWLAGWQGGIRTRVLSLTAPLTMRLFLVGLAGMALLLVPYNLAVYLIWPKDFAQDLRPFAELARSEAAPLAAVVVALGAPLSEELLFRGFLLPALVVAAPRTFVGVALAALVGQMLTPLGFAMLLPGQVLEYTTAGLVFGLNLLLLFAAAGAAVLDRGHDSGPSPSPSGFTLAALFTTGAWTLMHLGYSVMGLLEVFIIGLYFCWLMWRYGNLYLTIALHAFYNGAQMLVLMAIPLPAAA